MFYSTNFNFNDKNQISDNQLIIFKYTVIMVY